MKKVLVLMAIAVLIGTTTGCCNGPLRNLFQRNNQCNAPATDPSWVDDCQTCQYGNGAGPSWTDGGYGDPYIQGSNYGGAAISPPVFDGSSFPQGNGTTVSPPSAEQLPNPGGGF